MWIEQFSIMNMIENFVQEDDIKNFPATHQVLRDIDAIVISYILKNHKRYIYSIRTRKGLSNIEVFANNFNGMSLKRDPSNNSNSQLLQRNFVSPSKFSTDSYLNEFNATLTMDFVNGNKQARTPKGNFMSITMNPNSPNYKKESIYKVIPSFQRLNSI